jgi:hypothetical protein
MTTTSDLTVCDRLTGEALDVNTATTGRLARFLANLATLRAELADVESIVNTALVGRLDADLTWTQTLEDDGIAFKVTAPSPDAGSIDHLPDVLEAELRKLVARKVITAEGAGVALQRRLTVEVEVPLDADLAALATKVEQSEQTEIGGVAVAIVKVKHDRKAMKSGINKLAKLDGTNAALGRAKRFLPVSARRAKVEITGTRS